MRAHVRLHDEKEAAGAGSAPRQAAVEVAHTHTTSAPAGARPSAAPAQAVSTVPLVLVAASGVLFAGQGGCLKLIVARGFGAFEVVLARGAVQAAGVLFVMAVLERRGQLPRRKWLGGSTEEVRLLTVRALVGYLGIGFSFAALERLALGDASAIGQTGPLVSIAAAWALLGETIGVTEAVAFVGSSTGVLLVSRPPALFGNGGRPPDPIGVALALCGAVSAGLVLVIVRRLTQKVHWSTVLLYQAVGQMALSPPVALALGRAWSLPDPPTAALMLLGGLFAFAGQVTGPVAGCGRRPARLTRRPLTVAWPPCAAAGVHDDRPLAREGRPRLVHAHDQRARFLRAAGHAHPARARTPSLRRRSDRDLRVDRAPARPPWAAPRRSGC